MAGGLLALLRELCFVEAAYNRGAGPCDWTVADTLEAARSKAGQSSVRATIAHISSPGIDGRSTEAFVAQLVNLLAPAPLYAAADSSGSRDPGAPAAVPARALLSMLVDLGRSGALNQATLDVDHRQEDGSGKARTLEERVSAVERQIIEETLARHNSHRSRTAQELGISRVTLYNKMKRYGMLEACAESQGTK
jgi:DNA-binding protein Fis